MSEIKKLHDQLKYVSSSLNDISHRTNDTGNMFISMASISSIAEDRATCDVLLLDKMVELLNVKSIIPCTDLNVSSHLKEEDIVLVMYNYPSMSRANIISKLDNGTKGYLDNKSFQVTNRLDFSKWTI
jgi:hypothetical protein